MSDATETATPETIKPRRIRLMKVDRLKPNRRNARKHSPEQVGQIVASIERFGWTAPILVAGDDILAGHGRRLAALRLGIEKVPTIDLSDLDEAERRAYMLADNRIAESSGWDDTLLRVELAELRDEGFELDVIGFDPHELTSLLDEHDVSDAQIAELLGDEPKAAPEGDVRFGAMTSMTRGSKPWAFWQDRGDLGGEDVNTVIDFGCGKDDNGFARYDPFTAPDESVLLRRYDRVVCSYVLNVQPSDHLITMIAAVLRSIVRDDGLVLVAARNDLEPGVAESGRGYQVGKSWSEWAALLRGFFDVEDPEARDFHGFICKPKRAT